MKKTIDKTLIEENEARTQMDGIELCTKNDTITLKLMITVLILFNCILFLCYQMMKDACSSFPVIQQKSLLIGRTPFGSSHSINTHYPSLFDLRNRAVFSCCFFRRSTQDCCILLCFAN